MIKYLLIFVTIVYQCASGDILDEKINYSTFLLARNDFVANQGGGSYISGGREIIDVGKPSSMTDADIGILALYLLKKNLVTKRDFFRGLFSEKAYVRCASGYAMEHEYGKNEEIPDFNYTEDPLSDDNWKNIIFWRSSLLQVEP